MSSPFDSAFTQRVDKVSTALNEGHAAEAAYQMRGMIEDDPLQAIRLIRDAEKISSAGAIDHITRDRAGDVFIVNGATGESTFAGRLGSHGQAGEPEPIEPPARPPGYYSDQPVQPQIKEWQPDYPVKEWHPRWIMPRYAREYELPPDCVFNGYPRPYYGYGDTVNVGWHNRDYFNFRLRF